MVAPSYSVQRSIGSLIIAYEIEPRLVICDQRSAKELPCRGVRAQRFYLCESIMNHLERWWDDCVDSCGNVGRNGRAFELLLGLCRSRSKGLVPERAD